MRPYSTKTSFPSPKSSVQFDELDGSPCTATSFRRNHRVRIKNPAHHENEAENCGSAIGLCSAVATTAIFGQSTYVWTNQNPAHASPLGTSTPPPIGAPTVSPAGRISDGITFGDEMQFDGQTTGPLIATQNGGSQVNGSGAAQPYGLRIHLTANQTSPVTIISPVSVSAGMRMNYFTVDAGSGGLIIGNTTLRMS